jgi:predicted small lipoprotein YifL
MATALTKKFGIIVVTMVAAAAVLSACGRAGPPIKPSQAAIERAKEAKETPPEAPVPNSQNEDKRFILDGLLE